MTVNYVLEVCNTHPSWFLFQRKWAVVSKAGRQSMKESLMYKCLTRNASDLLMLSPYHRLCIKVEWSNFWRCDSSTEEMTHRWDKIQSSQSCEPCVVGYRFDASWRGQWKVENASSTTSKIILWGTIRNIDGGYGELQYHTQKPWTARDGSIFVENRPWVYIWASVSDVMFSFVPAWICRTSACFVCQTSDNS